MRKSSLITHGRSSSCLRVFKECATSLTYATCRIRIYVKRTTIINTASSTRSRRRLWVNISEQRIIKISLLFMNLNDDRLWRFSELHVIAPESNETDMPSPGAVYVTSTAACSSCNVFAWNGNDSTTNEFRPCPNATDKLRNRFIICKTIQAFKSLRSLEIPIEITERVIDLELQTKCTVMRFPRRWNG